LFSQALQCMSKNLVRRVSIITDKTTKVRKVLITTLVLNIFVMILKVVIAWWTGSLSLLADVLHSLTDSASNVLGLITTYFSSPYPDREHPYGHLKFEAVGALGIAAFLGIACFEILQGALERIFKGGSGVKISVSELWLLLIVLGVNIFVAFYERHVGKRVSSPILIADAKHTMSDVWVTITIIFGLIGVWLGYWWLDILLAFPIAFLVFWSSCLVLKDNVPWLVDEVAIAPESIHDIATSIGGILGCYDISSRGVIGRQVFIEMRLIVNVYDIGTAHQITEELERILEERFGPARIFIHVEPPVHELEQINFDSDESE